MIVGEIFKEEVKILRGFDNEGNPIVEDGIIKWEIVEVYDEMHFLAKNKDGELKAFSIRLNPLK